MAGRAGRGDRPGRVIVQTLQPDHFSLACAARHDFGSFATSELETRRELGYPPYSRLVLLRMEGESLGAVEEMAREVALALRRSATSPTKVLGPAPSPLERLRGRHRFQVLLRGAHRRDVRNLASAATRDWMPQARRRGLRLLVDVDPYDML